jgi:hypothetical protein
VSDHAPNHDEPFDPAKQYPGCGCHPKHAPVGTVARETYEAWVRQKAAEHHAAKAARRENTNA